MKTIGVFFGSRSAEHDVSIITGQLIISELKKMGHTPVAVYLSKKGEWCLGEGLDSLKSFVAGTDVVSKHTAYYLDLEQSRGKIVFKQKGVLGKEVIIDIAFPAFHGTFGEDGTMQGLFEMLWVPYVGCGVPTSAIAMDKVLTKQMLQSQNIPTTQFVWGYKSEWETNKNVLLTDAKQLQLPVFVKPAHMGSSIGISKVKNWNELEDALSVAFHYDDKALVEEGVPHVMDTTCALLETRTEIKTSLLQESTFAGDMFDYSSKYLEGSGDEAAHSGPGIVIPARLDEAKTRQIQEWSKTIFRVLGGNGTMRVDFLVNSTTGDIFANEINPLPGTLYQHLWEKSGVSLSEILTELLDAAQRAHAERSNLLYSFDSPILQQLKGSKLGTKMQS